MLGAMLGEFLGGEHGLGVYLLGSLGQANPARLWDIGIVTNQSLSQEEQSARLRDVLMAFRLRLASLATISPLIDFPALLAMPPSTVPQPVPLFAIIQPDEANQANVTLLLPNEVSLTISPSN